MGVTMLDTRPEDRTPRLEGIVRDGRVAWSGDLEVLLGHQIDLGQGRPPGGNWVHWRVDGDELTVRNDRYGAFPVYYAATDDGIVVSPSVEAILATGVDRTLDLDALAAFLTIGYYLADDTAFRVIRAVPPAAVLTWRAGHLEVQSTPPRHGQVDIPRPEAMARAAELMRAAVRRMIPDDSDYLFPLSGGRDSRLILLELVAAGHPPSACVTAHHHANVWGGDPPVAAEVAASLGLAHRIVRPGPLIPDEWAKNRTTSYCADEHAWYRCVAAELNGRTSHTYDGLSAAAPLLESFYSPKLRKLTDAGRWDDLAAAMGRRLEGKPRYAPLIAPGLRGELDAERAIARIRTELDRHIGESHPFRAFRLWNRYRRELSLMSSAMLHGVPAVYTPYLDHDFMDFVWTLPSSYLEGDFKDNLIAVHFPGSLSIPYRVSSIPQPGRRFMREIGRDLVRMLRAHSDGSLVDRSALMRRAARASLLGDDWLAFGRRTALTVYLVQLETIVAGRGPAAL